MEKMRRYDSYTWHEKNLPRINEKERCHPLSRSMWFEAPNKKRLLACIKRVPGCASHTLVEQIPFNDVPKRVWLADPWEAISIKREKVEIYGALFVKVCLADDVFFVSLIRNNECDHLQFIE